jgi:hypothetical protein
MTRTGRDTACSAATTNDRVSAPLPQTVRQGRERQDPVPWPGQPGQVTGGGAVLIHMVVTLYRIYPVESHIL